jgi:hypothetical protein
MLGNPSSAAPFVFNPYAYNGPYGSSATSVKATAVTSAGLGPWYLYGVPIAAWRINMNTWGSSTPTVVTFMQAGLKQWELTASCRTRVETIASKELRLVH